MNCNHEPFENCLCHVEKDDKHRKETFPEVLDDSWESIKIRRWIIELVPDDVKKEIVKRFNSNYRG